MKKYDNLSSCSSLTFSNTPGNVITWVLLFPISLWFTDAFPLAFCTYGHCIFYSLTSITNNNKIQMSATANWLPGSGN